MDFIKIKTKDVRAVVNATFPKYRKRTVVIRPTTKVTFFDLNWSGGTKADYRACTVAGDPLERKHDMGMAAPWNNPFEGKEIDLPKDVIIVEGGYFCGKDRQLYLHVHPDNMPKFITEGK